MVCELYLNKAITKGRKKERKGGRKKRKKEKERKEGGTQAVTSV